MNLLVSDYPRDVSILRMRANMEWEHGQAEAALFDLDEVLKLDPRDASCYVMKGDIHLQQKKRQKHERHTKSVGVGSFSG